MTFEGKTALLAYETVGEGTDVLLLHGLGCDHALMMGCMERVFASHPGYRRWYVDLPGMGGSGKDMKNASADAILAALAEFVKLLLPGPFLLVGESYGGYLAGGLAAKLDGQVNGLALLCPALVPEAAERDLPEPGATAHDETFLRTLSDADCSAFCEYGVVANEATYRRYREEIQPGFKKADGAFIEELKRHYAFSLPVDDYIFTGPALLITGRQDNCVGYRDTWARLEHFPRAAYAALDLAGHNLQIERPALFDALVADWLERVELSSSS